MSPAMSRGRYCAFCAGGAEEHQRQDAQVRLAAERRARTTRTARCAPPRRATTPCRDRGRRTPPAPPCPAGPARRSACIERRAQVPVLRLEAVERRHHLGGDELVGRLRHQAVLVREPLGREHVARPVVLEQPRAAARDSRHQPHLTILRGRCLPPPVAIVSEMPAVVRARAALQEAERAEAYFGTAARSVSSCRTFTV